jgi:hypothetical protein
MLDTFRKDDAQIWVADKWLAESDVTSEVDSTKW